MKKILIITGIVVVLLIATLAAFPLFFKQTLIEKAKITINKNVNAEVEFSDLKLSLLRSFPKVTLELVDVLVTGKGEFQNDTLFTVPSLRTKTALRQLFNRENIGIEEIILDRPLLRLVVGTTGNVNWDLMLESEETPETASADTQEEGLVLQLEKIEITDANFIYDDRETNMLLRLDDIDIDISGEMYGTSAQLLAEGNAAQLFLAYGGVNYITNTSVETRTVLNVDYDKMDIKIQENELLINRLPLEVLGLIQMPNDSMFFDLKLQTKESGFDNFLALVPPDYEDYLKDIQTSGTATISGTVKGFYFDEDYPAFNLKMDVANGNVHYA
ncbi:MAG: AsmA family protein, partial [Bacteroidales bacterium]|nr:AsmA family protein [Bacteroidales bacterium]